MNIFKFVHFNEEIKNKRDAKIKRCHRKVMIKTQDRFIINLHLTQNCLERKNCENKLFLAKTHLMLYQMAASPHSSYISLCKILFTFVLLIVLVITDQVLCLATLKFALKESIYWLWDKLRKVIIIVSFNFLFRYRSDHWNVLHPCLIQLLNFWWCAVYN